MRRHKILGFHAIMLVYLEMDIEHFLETEVEFRCETVGMRSGCYCNVMVFAELASPQILKRIIYSNNEYAQDSFEFIFSYKDISYIGTYIIKIFLKLIPNPSRRKSNTDLPH